MMLRLSHFLSPVSALLLLGIPGLLPAQTFGDEEESLYIPPSITVTEDRGKEDGLLITLNERHQPEWIAPVPVLFFDNPGDWLIPDRYVQFASPAATREYVDTGDVEVGKGWLGKYTEILNIIGYRMQEYPRATVAIRGCFSAEGGESAKVAHERALVVRDYLERVWEVDTTRLPLLPPARRADTLENNPKQEEARRVEFSSEEPGIFEPIAFDLVGHGQASAILRVLILPNMEPSKIDSIEFLMVGQGGDVYHRESIPWHPDSVRYTAWLRWFQMKLDNGEGLSLLVRIRGKDGRYRPSNRVMIPVKITEPEEAPEIWQPRRYRIPSGRYGDSAIDGRQQELIRLAAADFERLFAEEIGDGYIVLARGVVDVVEDPERSATEVNIFYAEKALERDTRPADVTSHIGEFHVVIRQVYVLKNGTNFISWPRATTLEEAEEQDEESRQERVGAREERKIRPGLLLADTVADARARAAIRFVQDSLDLPMLNRDIPEKIDVAQRLWGWVSVGSDDGRDRTDDLREGVQPSRGGAYPDILLLPEQRWYHRGLWMELWTWGHVERLVDIYRKVYGEE